MFEKVLIADRGDTAARVARTCKRMGVDTVVMCAERDASDVHVEAADEAIQVTADESGNYLDPAQTLEVAKRSGVQAIHPGYGPFARDPAFARATAEAGLTFVGSPPALLDLSRNRLDGRNVARMAGVRVALGSEGTLESFEDAARELDALEGGPVRLKPVFASARSYGPIDDLDSLREAFDRCSAENPLGAYMELEVNQPRRIDIQVVGDREGHIVPLWDRECSIRRFRGPLVVESPSPTLSGSRRGERVREAMVDSAVRIATEAGIEGPVSVRFLLDAYDHFYFVGLTAALDPDHDTTEMCTGVDLVELQMRIAAGEPMPEEAHRAAPSGHAMTARLCAENRRGDFLAEPCVVGEVRWPAATPGKLRVEAAVQEGSRLTACDGTTLAKITTWAPTRHQALLALDRTLAESVVAPVKSNVELLRQVLNHEAFRAGQYDATFVERLDGRG